MSNQTINFDTNPPVAANEYNNLVEMAMPGYSAMHTMVKAILKCRLPENAHLLIVGAGGGTEILRLSQGNPQWKILGVDPSSNMLAIAQQKIEQNSLSQQVSLFNGYVQDLPLTPLFDAATSILVMHFLPDDGSKLTFLQNIAQRLNSSATLFVVDVFGNKDTPEMEERISFVAAYRQEMGMPYEKHLEMMKPFNNGVHPVSEAREEELLQQAGFGNIMRFYTGLWVSGWIATKI